MNKYLKYLAMIIILSSVIWIVIVYQQFKEENPVVKMICTYRVDTNILDGKPSEKICVPYEEYNSSLNWIQEKNTSCNITIDLEKENFTELKWTKP